MYLLQGEKDYQRYDADTLKPGRRGPWYSLVQNDMKVTLMTHESYFDYFSFTVSLTSIHTFTVKELKKIIAQKINGIKQQAGRREFVYHYLIDQCMVENESVLHVLGKRGNLSFVIRVFVLQHSHVLELKKHCLVSNFIVVPKHLGVVLRLGKSINGPVSVMHFQKNEIIALGCQNGWYSSINIAPFGLGLLYSTFKDHDIAPYLYNDIERLEKTVILRQTVEEVFTFFLKQCVSRMQQHAVLGKPCIIICPFATHPVFVSILESLSANHHTHGFIPFSGNLINVATSDTDAVMVHARAKKSKK